MSAHTPGPWKLTNWSENIGVGSDRPKPRDCESIALVPRSVAPAHSKDAKIVEANARLIAAAPDLKHALETAYVMHRRNECPTDTTQHDANWQNHAGVECTCTAFNVVRAALKKSEGK